MVGLGGLLDVWRAHTRPTRRARVDSCTIGALRPLPGDAGAPRGAEASRGAHPDRAARARKSIKNRRKHEFLIVTVRLCETCKGCCRIDSRGNLTLWRALGVARDALTLSSGPSCIEGRTSRRSGHLVGGGCVPEIRYKYFKSLFPNFEGCSCDH